MSIQNLVIGIPFYNEQQTLEQLFKATREQTDIPMLLSDDGSTDDSPDIAEEISEKTPDVSLVRSPTNLGYGANLQRIINNATLTGSRYLIVLDSDLQHDPRYLPGFLKGLESATIVHGTRYHTKSPVVAESPKIRAFAGEITQSILNLIGIESSDPLCGYWGINLARLGKVNFLAQGYSAPLEFWYMLKQKGIEVLEVPVSRIFFDRDYALDSDHERIDSLAREFMETTLRLFDKLPHEQRLRARESFYEKMQRIWRQGRHELSSEQISILVRVLEEFFKK